MLRHIVMWQFKEEAEGKTREENCRIVKDLLEALTPVVPSIRKLEVGINAYPSDSSADLVLISEFDSKEGLDAYVKHPEHLRVNDYVSKVRLMRTAVDYIY
ncbi:Dabb family protein [Brucepastera parasyntrophica]|uniref:Dabb family protein n=1 Tax=Brucepastera parasyntrophica TaxID=2880008 RepID=UPI00210E0316|nr:Dabb family protein [Brucepastera parasyntrophica]ULQ59593.1 Dabb family protein [Brucepastera parasyntrophica]